MSVAHLPSDSSKPPRSCSGVRETTTHLVASPAELRKLSRKGLEQLGAAIRTFLVETVAETGGHLGSNLGVVELTIALHRVFDSPGDAIIWDTGHQAYVHKLLTGREKDFAGLRQGGGMSGYPNRTESEHDFVENSHASTGLSYGYGIAAARRLAGDERHVVVVVGDGALTGGLAFEALNNIGVSGERVLVVLNDNGRSYAPTVSRLATGAGPGSHASNEAAPGSPVDAGTSWHPDEQVQPAQAFCEALGIAYIGPVDGHDQDRLELALRGMRASSGPVLLHVHTQKGRGYAPAEQDEDRCLHDIGPFDPRTGVARRRPSAVASYTEAFGAALLVEGSRHPELVAVTAAMGSPTGLVAFRDRYPERFFDVGIAEQHAVTAAAGMAMAGLRPVVAIYSTFLNRAWDQVYYDVGLHRLPVVFCLDRSGITGDDGPSHHGVLDLALLTKVPGMTVLAPSSVDELPVMLAQALEITSGPVAIRWPKGSGRFGGEVGSGLFARKLRSRDMGATLGSVCLLGVGKLLAACEDAADLLGAAGVGATVFDVRAVAPLDPAMIADARTHDLVVCAEDGVVEGGAGSLVSAEIARSATRDGTASPEVTCLGVPVEYLGHDSPAAIHTRLGLDGEGIADVVLARLGRR